MEIVVHAMVWMFTIFLKKNIQFSYTLWTHLDSKDHNLSYGIYSITLKIRMEIRISVVYVLYLEAYEIMKN